MVGKFHEPSAVNLQRQGTLDAYSAVAQLVDNGSTTTTCMSIENKYVSENPDISSTYSAPYHDQIKR